jgi:hypothetical protein
MKKLLSLLGVLSVLSFSSVTFAQTTVDSKEISSTVPELTAFHEIIYPMWHEAYPAKDYNALKNLVPKIKTHMDNINNAKLPGILRDKESVWKSQLKELNISAQNYYSAANGNNNDALLSAAEELHSGYEKMVRVIRPALKEIDDFHKDLYIIYHKLLPDSKFDEISGMTGTLITKAGAIKNYPHDKLTARLGSNVDKFDAAAQKLYNSVESLEKVLKASDPVKKKEAVESMHSAYEEIDSLFI